MKNKIRGANSSEELVLIKQLLESIQAQVEEARNMLEKIGGGKSSEIPSTLRRVRAAAKDMKVLEGGKIVEGVFDGQNMQGPDSKTYPIPPNYASKSKLIEGDVMKLTIMPDGSFVFKQIGPVERKKIIGRVTSADTEYQIEAEKKRYKVLTASATYYKLAVGDEVTIIVAEKGKCSWCAIENVIKKSEESSLDDLDVVESIKKEL